MDNETIRALRERTERVYQRGQVSTSYMKLVDKVLLELCEDLLERQEVSK